MMTTEQCDRKCELCGTVVAVYAGSRGILRIHRRTEHYGGVVRNQYRCVDHFPPARGGDADTSVERRDRTMSDADERHTSGGDS